MAKKDIFGSREGSNEWKANAVLSATRPKTMDKLREDGAFHGDKDRPTVYEHMNEMEKKGYVRIDRTADPYTYYFGF